MSKFLFWLFAAPLLLFFVIFATSNSDVVELSFWPLPFTIAAPLYLFFLLVLFVSFFLGAVAMWIGQHHWRAEARRKRREVDKLQAQLSAATSPPPPITTVTATTREP